MPDVWEAVRRLARRRPPLWTAPLMDEFDDCLRDRLNSLERQVSSLTRDRWTLLQALTVHEGINIAATSLRHLGRLIPEE